MDRIRVLLVNETCLMSSVISAVLEDEPDIEIIGSATTMEQALRQVRRCDVALVSTRLPDDKALELTQLIAGTYSDVKILMLGLTESKAEIIQYAKAGADGYVLQDDSVEEMVEAIRTLQKGAARVSPQIAAALMSRINELT